MRLDSCKFAAEPERGMAIYTPNGTLSGTAAARGRGKLRATGRRRTHNKIGISRNGLPIAYFQPGAGYWPTEVQI